jgi:uracil-DNA glycosylase family 4
MQGSKKIIGSNCGPINSKIMFIGEAPGRKGAEQSLIPFKGDKSGENFEFLLSIANLKREEVHITNALLCNPKDGNRNGAPKIAEIKNCNSYLKAQIDIVNPKWIFTLGSVALKAISFIEAHNLTLRNNVGVKYIWNDRFVIPLYHPGQRAMIHRPMQKQIEDYLKIKNLLEE